MYSIRENNMEQVKDDKNLTQKIIKLISLKQEGGYWDFKREWHNNNTDLLHDIICMANNLHNRNAYIIIGIDEEKEYKIKDVNNDPHRKSTQNIVDFLKDKKFAGGIRPLVHVEHISLYNGDIDVIVIENCYNTPFYLTEKFEGIRANHIYTRVMDTNTPIDKSADINNVEYLWRKRFHLDDTPLERVTYFLNQHQDWVESPIEFDLCKFYKYSPEFVLREEHDETRTGYEFYLFGQMNTHPSWYTVTLYYYQTALEQFIGASLDGGRCFVIAPPMSGISFSGHHNWDLSYRYYEKDSLQYILTQFFRAEGTSEYEYAFQQFMKCVLVFQSETEREQFELYIKWHEDYYRKLYSEQGDTELPHFPDLKGYNMEAFKTDYRNALVMQKMLSDFRLKE